MTPLTQQDAKQIFRDLMVQEWNNIMTQSSNNIRVGRIESLNTDTFRASVKILNTGEILSSVSYPKGTKDARVGDVVMIASADPKVKGQNYIVGVYGQESNDITVPGTLNIGGPITQTGDAAHIVLTPGTNKLVKDAVLRQDNTSNTYVNDVVELTGWGFIQGDGASNSLSESVTFGITFDEIPIVTISYAGARTSASGAPSDAGDFNAGYGTDAATVVYGTKDVTTGGFTAIFRTLNNATLGTAYMGYTWKARGKL